MSRAHSPVLRLFAFPALTASVAFGALVASATVACGTSTTTPIVAPITGVTVLAESVTRGRGCGTGGSQIFKYAVVVQGRDPANKQSFAKFLALGVYDCFSDAQFVDLPPSADSTDYALQVYAYNQAAFAAASGALTAAAVDQNPSGLVGTNPTLTTTCTGTQIDQVQSLAVCQPLSAGTTAVGTPAAPATVKLSAASFPAGDGGAFACDAQYATVRYRIDVGDVVGPVTEARCSQLTGTGLTPVVITVSPAVAPASYLIEVALLRTDGSVLGQTTCGAETSPGLTSSAVCKPIQ